MNGAVTTEYRGDKVLGGRLSGSENARASCKRAKGQSEDYNYHKTPGYGVAQERVGSNHDVGGQEASDWRHNPHQDRHGPGRRSSPEGGRGGLRNGGGNAEPIRENPKGLTGALSISRAMKGGRTEGGKGGRK